MEYKWIEVNNIVNQIFINFVHEFGVFFITSRTMNINKTKSEFSTQKRVVPYNKTIKSYLSYSHKLH